MSQENVEIVRKLYEAFDRGDVGGTWDLLHLEAELHQPPELVDGDSYYGRDEFMSGLIVFLQEWEQVRFEPQEIAEAGDGIIMAVRVSGTGKASGIETSTEFFQAWTVLGGETSSMYRALNPIRRPRSRTAASPSMRAGGARNRRGPRGAKRSREY